MRVVLRRSTAVAVCCGLGMLSAFEELAVDVAPQADPVVVLMIKPGDPSAREDLAKDFLELFAEVLENRVRAFDGREVVVRLTNDPARAADQLDALDPTLVLAPPGFHLQHLRPLAKPDPDPKKRRKPATPLLEIPRFEQQTEQYCLVVPKASESQRLEDLEGLRVASAGAIDWPWMKRLVFPKSFDPKAKLRLTPAKNLSDEVFDLLDGVETAPSALLLDREMRRFFENDEFVWKELRVVWTSRELPRHVVVARGTTWTDEKRRQLVEDLRAIGGTEKGKEVLKLIDSKGLRPLDAKRWAGVLGQYFPKNTDGGEDGR